MEEGRGIAGIHRNNVRCRCPEFSGNINIVAGVITHGIQPPFERNRVKEFGFSSVNLSMIRSRGTLGVVLSLLAAASALAGQSPRIGKSGNTVALQNDRVRLEFDLSSGNYSVFDKIDGRPVISKARLGINGWYSDDAGFERSWRERAVSDTCGKGLALDLGFKSRTAPELLFSFVLYEGRDFFGHCWTFSG